VRLTEFAGSLRRHDASLALGLLELVRRAGPDGRLERGEWLAAVRSSNARLRSGRALLNESADGTAELDPIDVERYLDEQILARLGEAGMAVAEPPGPAWEHVTVAPAVWAEVTENREAATNHLKSIVTGLIEGAESVRSFETPPATGSTLRTRGLVKTYRRRRVVADVDLSVSQGEIVGLLGPNGAGKTTTFYMIVGLIAPDEGRVFLDDTELTRVPMYKRARKGLGYLAQEPSVFRKLTVEENIQAILETLGLRRSERKARLEELLDELGLKHLRKSPAYSLSGGERRRLEITRALVSRPKFMLLDEPFAGIDPIAVNDIQQIVADLRHRGIGVVITDHNVEQTLDIVDRAYIMYDGRVRVSGTVAELVWNDEVAEIYFGPTLTARMRERYHKPDRVA
jgi:lipopolysaccharide export system ATP-binding protein